jgi:hypothetical protein
LGWGGNQTTWFGFGTRTQRFEALALHWTTFGLGWGGTHSAWFGFGTRKRRLGGIGVILDDYRIFGSVKLDENSVSTADQKMIIIQLKVNVSVNRAML